MNRRADEVAPAIQRELADIIHKRLQDPGIGYVTITRVQLSDDLRRARVFVSEMSTDGKRLGRSLEALERAKGFLRSELGKRVRLRKAPELEFAEDHSIEEGSRMSTLLDQVAADLPPEPDDGEGPTE
jgi:ribosome-binding factor A